MQRIKQTKNTSTHQTRQGVLSGKEERTQQPVPSGLPQKGLILFFGVVLPLIAVLFETTFHFCARHFFDPFPTTNHVILFLLIPLSNYLTLLASRRNLSAHYSFITLASGMALGMGAMYSLMFLPLMGSSLYFIGAFGFGLLGLAPALSLPCTWMTGKKACKLSAERKTYFNPHQLEHIGHLIILVMVLAVELPSTLTRVYLGLAAAPATDTEGIRWLRKYGSEEVMLRACYERSGRATDIIGSLYESGHPLPVSEARRIFYRVTGKPFNSVPIPASARATIQHALAYDPGGLNAKVEDEFDLDTDIAGQTVSGVARGLSVSAINVRGKVDADAMLAEIDWSFAFTNVSKYDREARSKILLPAGAVLSRATLTINNKEHEATIMVREAAREYYRQAVYQHKDDPLLVSTSGADQVLVQCYPVHPDSNMKVKLHIICPLSFDKDGMGTLVLPAFAEKNFQVNVPANVSLDSETPLTITGPSFAIKSSPVAVQNNLTDQTPSDTTAASHSGENKAKWQLETKINAGVIEQFAAIIHGKRNRACRSVFCRDTFLAPPVVLERLIRKSQYIIPEKLTVLIDGSAAMKSQMPEITKGLLSLSQEISARIVLVADGEKILGVEWTKPGTSPYRQALKALEEFIPTGGQDNSNSLLKFAREMAAGDSAVLWIHAGQPISIPGSGEELKGVLNRKRAELLRNQSAAETWNPDKPLLYDLQVAEGPVEILSTIDNCSGFKRVERSGSIADDLQQLYKSWHRSIESNSAEFVVRPSISYNSDDPVLHQTSSALAQLFAYRRILASLEQPAPSAQESPYTLARQYHLISPVSSAVVTDTVAELIPLPKPAPDMLAEFFSSRTVENVYSQISLQCNCLIREAATFPAISGSLVPQGALMQATNQTVRSVLPDQLNKLNRITNTEISQYTDRLSSPSAPLLQGATNGTIASLNEKSGAYSTADSETSVKGMVSTGTRYDNSSTSPVASSGGGGAALPGSAGDKVELEKKISEPTNGPSARPVVPECPRPHSAAVNAPLPMSQPGRGSLSTRPDDGACLLSAASQKVIPPVKDDRDFNYQSKHKESLDYASSSAGRSTSRLLGNEADEPERQTSDFKQNPSVIYGQCSGDVGSLGSESFDSLNSPGRRLAVLAAIISVIIALIVTVRTRKRTAGTLILAATIVIVIPAAVYFIINYLVNDVLVAYAISRWASSPNMWLDVLDAFIFLVLAVALAYGLLRRKHSRA